MNIRSANAFFEIEKTIKRWIKEMEEANNEQTN
jgi:hypothetical protein